MQRIAAGFGPDPLIILRTTVSIGTTRNAVLPESGFTPSDSPRIVGDRVYYVGNVMIDTLFWYRERGRASSILEPLSVEFRGSSLLTLPASEQCRH